MSGSVQLTMPGPGTQAPEEPVWPTLGYMRRLPAEATPRESPAGSIWCAGRPKEATEVVVVVAYLDATERTPANSPGFRS